MIQLRRKMLTTRGRVARRRWPVADEAAETSSSVLSGIVLGDPSNAQQPQRRDCHRQPLVPLQGCVVMWVRCHCQPARLMHLNCCSML